MPKARNPITDATTRICAELKAARQAMGLSQGDVGDGMVLEDGGWCPYIRGLQEGYEDDPSDVNRKKIIKAVSRIENGEQALIVDVLLPFCRAIGVDPAVIFARAGYSQPTVSPEAAILADPGFTTEQRTGLLNIAKSFRQS